MTSTLRILAFAAVASLPTSLVAQSGPGYVNRFLELPDAAAPYPFRARDITVSEALEIFGDNLRIGVSGATELEGTLGRETPGNLTREQYLDDLALEFDFVWYFDGTILQVSPLGETETRIIPLRDNDGDVVISVLRALDVYQTKFVHRVDARSRTFLVSGPTDYVELVAQAVDAIETAARTDITLLRGNGGSVPEALSALNTAEDAVGVTPNAGTNAPASQ